MHAPHTDTYVHTLHTDTHAAYDVYTSHRNMHTAHKCLHLTHKYTHITHTAHKCIHLTHKYTLSHTLPTNAHTSHTHTSEAVAFPPSRGSRGGPCGVGPCAGRVAIGAALQAGGGQCPQARVSIVRFEPSSTTNPQPSKSLLDLVSQTGLVTDSGPGLRRGPVSRGEDRTPVSRSCLPWGMSVLCSSATQVSLFFLEEFK